MGKHPDRLSLFASLATSAVVSAWKYWTATVIVVLLALISSFPPAVEGDILRLIPSDDPAASAIFERRREPGGEGIVAITVPGSADTQELSARLRELPTVLATFPDSSEPEATKLALFQFDPEEIYALAESIRYAIAFRNPGLLEIPTAPESPLTGTNGLFDALVDDDATSIDRKLVFVIPTTSSEDLEFSMRLLDDLESVVPAGSRLAGPHIENAAGAREISRDLARTSGFSLLFVIVIVGIAFWHVAGAMVLVIPIVAANVISIAIVEHFSGPINLYTSIGGAVLFGLGVDFGIHLVSRFREERLRTDTAEQAVRIAWQNTGPPCVTAAATSAAGFLVFLTADFRGLSQLGLMLAVGVLLSLLLMLILLPSLLCRLSIPARRQPRADRIKLPEPLMPIIAIVAITLTIATFAPRLAFDYDLGEIRSEGTAWDEMSEPFQRAREAGLPPVVVYTDQLRDTHRYFDNLVNAGRLSNVRGVFSLASLIPEDQDDHLQAISKLIEASRHPRRAILPDKVREVLDVISELDASPVTVADLPSGLAHILGGEREQVMLLLQGNLLDMREANKLAKSLEPHTTDAVNEFLAVASLYRILSSDIPRIGVLAILVVILILVIDLRRMRYIAIGSGALLLGLVWTAGTLSLLSIPVNVVNVVALPMLLGIGIDVIIHMLHRLKSGDDITVMLKTTGVAVLLGIATTIAAFVALTMAENRGLKSLALTVTIGLSAILLSSLLLLLSAWRTGRHH